VGSKTSSRYRPPSQTKAPPVSKRGRQTERDRERAQARQTRRARFGTGPLHRRVLDALVNDAPAWNATWAALLLVAPVAWALGAWLLPALDIRPRADLTFLSGLDDTLKPEPLEQQRYFLTLLAAFAIVPTALLVTRRAALARFTRYAPAVGLLAVVAVAGVSLVRGYALVDRYYAMGPVLAIVATAVLAYGVATLFAARARWVALTVDRLSRRRSLEVLVFLIVIAVAFCVVAVGIYNDRDVVLGPGQTQGHMEFTYEEVTAVFYGRTPLVDFTPQYTVLLSWLLAPLYLIRAPDLAFFTETIAGLGIIALVCLYATYRLVTGTAARALLLYVPTVAIGFVVVDQVEGWQVHTIAGYFALMPIRDLGPLALGLLTVLIVPAGPSRVRAVVLGAAAATVILLNVDFGLPAAAAAALAALLLRQDDRSRVRRSATLVAEMATGAVAVFVLFALMTLVRSGSLPDAGQMLYFQRQFAAAGFFMLPMDHLLDFHTVVFATSAAAAIAGLGLVAFGRVRPGIHGRRSAVLLVYSGIFGFGAFEYYVGRTHPDVLSATFLSWGVSLMALCWEAGCRLAAGGTTARAIRPAATVLLVGATILGVDAIRHLEYAVHQPARLAEPSTEFKLYADAPAVKAARSCIPSGANVLVLTAMPDRVARAAHLHNWYAYDHPTSMVTKQQVHRMFDVAARHHVTAAVTQNVPRSTMAVAGYTPVRTFPYQLDIPEFDFPGGTTVIWTHGSRSVDCHGLGEAPNIINLG
jgi:hypothetical protein